MVIRANFSREDEGYAKSVNCIWQKGPCNPETLDTRHQYDDVNFGLSLGYQMRGGEVTRIIAGIWERVGIDDKGGSWLTDIQNHNPRGIDPHFVEALERHMGVVEAYKQIGDNERAAALTLLSVIERARAQFWF